MKSVFLTGASGVGKSTTYHGLIEYGFTPSPNHLTRPRRENEQEGLDAHFISVDQFAANIAIGAYLESTMEEAEYGGVYYGSPIQWETDAVSGEVAFAAIPSNVVSLRGLIQRLEDRNARSNILWVNLYAPLETRHDRVSSYITNPEQLRNRLYNGVGQGTKSDADINIDTSDHSPNQVIETVLQLTK